MYKIRFLDLTILLTEYYGSLIIWQFDTEKIVWYIFLMPSYYMNGQNKSSCHICKYDVFTFVAFVESGNEIESQA